MMTLYDVTYNYGNTVSMATEVYLYRFAFDSIETSYLDQISSRATAISESTCCHGNSVAIATEKYFYNSGIEGV